MEENLPQQLKAKDQTIKMQEWMDGILQLVLNSSIASAQLQFY